MSEIEYLLETAEGLRHMQEGLTLLRQSAKSRGNWPLAMALDMLRAQTTYVADAAQEAAGLMSGHRAIGFREGQQN